MRYYGEPVWLAKNGSSLDRKFAPARATGAYASALGRVIVLVDEVMNAGAQRSTRTASNIARPAAVSIIP